MPHLNEITNEIKNAIVNIKIIGIGGGGNNVVKRIASISNLDLDLIAVNTDIKQLNSLDSEKITKIQIGASLTKGLGCGGNVKIAQQAAENDYDVLKKALVGADMVFLTAGLGAGTGTGALPTIAKIAHDLGILSVGVVTVPFKFEGSRKQKAALCAISEVAPYMDALIAVHNDNLLKLKTNSKLTLVNAFQIADNVLLQGIRCVSELILTVGVINVDFADVKSIFQQSDHPDALLGIGESADDAVEAVQQAVNSPLVERDLAGARGIILNISGNKDLRLYDINEATKYIYEHTHPDVNIILGTVVNDELGDKIRATIIATDFADSVPISEKPAEKTAEKTTATQKSAQTTTKTPKPEDEGLNLPDFMKKKTETKSSNFSAFSFFNFNNKK